jgi:hypothetical protein
MVVLDRSKGAQRQSFGNFETSSVIESNHQLHNKVFKRKHKDFRAWLSGIGAIMATKGARAVARMRIR